MISILFIAILLLLAVKAKPLFQRYSLWMYLTFTILAILSYIFINSPLATPYKTGYLGLSFIYVVMLVGALPMKQKQPKENPVRRDYSILGFISITPHALYYITETTTGSISPAIFGILAYIIMIPLFVTSFPRIRHLMKEKSWKNLQKLAYLSYLFLFIHLIINSDGMNLILYIVLFSIYFMLKVLKLIKKKNSVLQ